jgi:glucose-1-phosphate adenylyltransferase
MLEYHIEKRADVTISLIEVPWAEASRFGIMNTNEEYRITDFEEKPSHPKNNLASMGIYIFSWNILKEYLEMDDRDPNSSHDFGKDVIPMLLDEKKKLYAYPFKGYWKDVGTVQSLWEANMDLLGEDCELDLFDNDWRIYSVNPNQPPQYISPDAMVHESLINEGCTIEGNIDKSVLFQGVTVGKNTMIKESVIMPDAEIGKNCLIEKAIVPGEVKIPDGTVIRSLDDEIVLVTEEMLDELYPAI